MGSGLGEGGEHQGPDSSGAPAAPPCFLHPVSVFPRGLAPAEERQQALSQAPLQDLGTSLLCPLSGEDDSKVPCE